jgi:hypothetical protein
VFSLSVEDDCRLSAQDTKMYKLKVCKRPELVPPSPTTTSSLNPLRPPEILTPEIFDLVCTQMKYIVGLSHKVLIQKTMKATVDAARVVLPARAIDFGELLWRNPPRCSAYEGSVIAVEVPTAGSTDAERRRGRSPGRGARALPTETRKYSQSLPKNGNRSTMVAGGIASSGKPGQAAMSATSPAAANMDLGTASNDSDGETAGRPPVASGAERRSRSSSTGARLSSGLGSSKNLKRLTIAPVATADDGSVDDEPGLSGGTALNGVYVDGAAAKQIAVMQSLPPEVQVRIFQTKGPVYGQWMVAHPLQVRSAVHADMIRVVEDSVTPAAKKLEWELDILREFDEKRMEQFEKFLVSRRIRSADAEVRKPLRRNVKGIEYYRDKGRQASNR